MARSRKPDRKLRTGFTTGACATAAAAAAYQALLTGSFPDPVTISLPKGEAAAFPLAEHELTDGVARAAVIKDAGDDPDVTHGALIRATLRRLPAGAGVVFRAGEGIGTVTLPGLPLAVGEPAINPVPRRMMQAAIIGLAEAHGASPDAEITISVPNGERLAARTMNGRLGIKGGLSILGTTGIVIPYSCSAWVHSIESGIDVARALGLAHVAGATGRTSEAAVKAHHGLADNALIDMGDFVGAMLKYLRRHPVPRVTIAGGPAKLAKLAVGHLDLHSKRSRADAGFLAVLARDAGLDDAAVRRIADASSVAQALLAAGDASDRLADTIAEKAREVAAGVLQPSKAPIALDVLVFDREGRLIGRAGP
ncbi:MAG: cobalt-precorrin-5B (C(1))-methyltransferase [Alphaproteobacteria bacterium]